VPTTPQLLTHARDRIPVAVPIALAPEGIQYRRARAAAEALAIFGALAVGRGDVAVWVVEGGRAVGAGGYQGAIGLSGGGGGGDV
jgi:hypothetical protein